MIAQFCSDEDAFLTFVTFCIWWSRHEAIFAMAWWSQRWWPFPNVLMITRMVTCMLRLTTSSSLAEQHSNAPLPLASYMLCAVQTYIILPLASYMLYALHTYIIVASVYVRGNHVDEYWQLTMMARVLCCFLDISLPKQFFGVGIKVWIN